MEGARSNILVVTGDGRLVTSPLHLGAVSGIARQLVMERVPDVAEEELKRDALLGASEVIAVNAVRGAVAIVSIDGRPVGDGLAGPASARLAEALSYE